MIAKFKVSFPVYFKVIFIQRHRRTGRHFTGGAEKFALKITIFPKNTQFALKLTFYFNPNGA